MSIQVTQQLLHLVASSVILRAVWGLIVCQTWSYKVRSLDVPVTTYTAWDFWSTRSTMIYHIYCPMPSKSRHPHPSFHGSCPPTPPHRKCQAVDGTGICHSCRWFFFWFQVASFLPCISWRCEVFARKVENTFWTQHSASACGYWQNGLVLGQQGSVCHVCRETSAFHCLQMQRVWGKWSEIL